MKQLLSLTIAILGFHLVVAQPANDDPSGAITFQHADGHTFTGTTVGATGTDPGNTSSCLGRDNSVWYKFVAQTSEITLDISLAANSYPAIRLFSVNAGSELECIGSSALPHAQHKRRLGYGTLTIGATYYIMIDHNVGQTASFTVTVKDHVIYDFKEGAVDITIPLSGGVYESGFLAYTNVDMTNEVIEKCEGFDQVWFTFTAQSAALHINASGSGGISIRNPYIHLYDQNASLIKCYDYRNTTEVHLLYDDFIIGEKYFFTVSSAAGNQGAFSVSVKSSIGNVFPQGAINLPHDFEYCSSNGEFESRGVLKTFNPSCASNAGGDSWFKFTAVSDLADIEVKVGNEFGTMVGPIVTLLDQNFNEIVCSYPSSQINYTGLAVGNLYYIVVSREVIGSNISTFTLCLNSGVELCSWSCDDIGNQYYAGKVGVGTSNIPDGFQLAVKGDAILERVKVQLSEDWPDYVFEKDYELKTLEATKEYINQYQHLPGIPSAAKVKEQGIDVGDMNAKLLKKIEELTLYIIRQNERLKKVEAELKELKSSDE